MFYVYKDVIDGNISTMLVSSDKYMEFKLHLMMLPTYNNIKQMVNIDYGDIVMNPQFSGIKIPVVQFIHDNEEQQNNFIIESSYTDVSRLEALDFHMIMIEDKKATDEKNAPDYHTKTLEEEYGLDINDPFDKRTDEEKERDKNYQKQYKAQNNEHDSFGNYEDIENSRETQKSVDGIFSKSAAIAAISIHDEKYDVSGKTNDELFEKLKSFGFTNIFAVVDDHLVPREDKSKTKAKKTLQLPSGKTISLDNFTIDPSTGNIKVDFTDDSGEIDEDLKEKRKKAKEDISRLISENNVKITPDDFMNALMGDGSSLGNSVKKDNDIKNDESNYAPSIQKLRKIYQKAQGEWEETYSEQEKMERSDNAIGIVRGTNIDDRDTIDYDFLPVEVTDIIENDRSYEVTSYPFNAWVGDKIIVPINEEYQLHNMDLVGETIFNGNKTVISKLDEKTEDGYIIVKGNTKKIIKVRFQ